jgi:ribonuclease HI
MGLGGHAECYDAELAALMMAANRASNYTREHPEVTSVHIFSDCSSALGSALNRKPTAGQHYSSSFCRSITQILTDNPRIHITLAWCPSHSDIRGNDRADTLAKQATEQAHNSPINVTRTNALRRAKATATKLWIKEWKKTALVGHYAIANRFPPSLKPTPHFTALKNQRELFGRTVQCRSGHGYTGEFRREFKLEGPYSCPCSEPL